MSSQDDADPAEELNKQICDKYVKGTLYVVVWANTSHRIQHHLA